LKILIETFSAPGCPKCARSRDALRSAAQELCGERLDWRDVNVLEEMDHAVELGVMTPPSLAIDGELVFPALPSPERLRDELRRRLATGVSQQVAR
jgi:thioredoxin 1